MKKLSLTIKSLLIASIILIGCNKDAVEEIYLNPDAGPSFLEIENDGYQVELGAIPVGENQTGTWRIYVGENGRFDNINDPKSKFYGEPGEVYQIGWEVNERTEYEADQITVSFKSLNPVIEMIATDTIFNNRSLYLEAAEAKFGSLGKWTIVDGENGRIENAENHEAEFIGEDHLSYTVRWTLSYGSKEAFEEYSFTNDELNAFAGFDNLDIITERDTDKYYNLNAYLPAGAQGEWKIISGEKGEVYNASNANSLFNGDPDEEYKLTWTVNLDTEQSIDTLNLRFRGIWGVYVDLRDGQSYKFTELNGLEWMSENFNYNYDAGNSSWYYGHSTRSVVTDGHAIETAEDKKYYGKLYTWATAMLVAPEGWRLPTEAELSSLRNLYGGGLYSDPRLKEGGDLGLNFMYGGHYDYVSSSDPAYRNTFEAQEIQGLYWCSDFAEVTSRSTAYIVGKTAELISYTYLYGEYYGASVRYVREVQQ